MMYQQRVNSTQQSDDGVNNYLVTQAVDTNSLPEDKLSGDLAALTQQEEKVNYREDMSRSIDDSGMSRAMKALRLANPFKGY